MLQRVLSRSKVSVSSVSSRSWLKPSRSLSSPSYSEDIEKLFRYTSGRWLYNEREQNDIRYTRFDPNELVRVACEAVGAHSCTLFTKLEEGSYNKAFRLNLDDSLDIIARLPCPLAGPSHLVTASEVATLQFAREVLNLPVPRVITWSGANRGHTNTVGADYIIMEQVPGVSLCERWERFGGPEDVRPILCDISDVEAKIGSLCFSRIGSLYFKEDVSPDLQTVPLLTGSVDPTTRQLAERYRVGPLIDYHWWRGERAHMALDRGPWPDACSFFIAAAKNEQTVLHQHSSKMSRYRRKPTHDLATHLKLLSMYIDAVPHFMPPSDSNICAPTLWHPDLGLDNLFVSASGPANLQGIIDWQHATILPHFNFASLPPAFVYDGDKVDMNGFPPVLPSNMHELSAEEQAECRLQLRLAYRHKWYESTIWWNPRRRAAASLPHIQELMMLPTYVTRAWVDGVFDLREALVRLSKNWAAIADPNTPCPIKFSAQEMMEHERQMEDFRCYAAAVKGVFFALQCMGDGWVSHENYGVVRKLIEELEETWDETNQTITGSPFPFKDGEYSYFIS